MWPREPSRRDNEGVDFNVAASDVTGSLGGAEPTKDGVEPSFVESGVIGLKINKQKAGYN